VRSWPSTPTLLVDSFSAASRVRVAALAAWRTAARRTVRFRVGTGRGDGERGGEDELLVQLRRGRVEGARRAEQRATARQRQGALSEHGERNEGRQHVGQVVAEPEVVPPPHIARSDARQRGGEEDSSQHKARAESVPGDVHLVELDRDVLRNVMRNVEGREDTLTGLVLPALDFISARGR